VESLVGDEVFVTGIYEASRIAMGTRLEGRPTRLALSDSGSPSQFPSVMEQFRVNGDRH
jgi:hypothetical protein